MILLDGRMTKKQLIRATFFKVFIYFVVFNIFNGFGFGFGFGSCHMQDYHGTDWFLFWKPEKEDNVAQLGMNKSFKA